MAVLVEAISVIVRRMAIADRFTGGWPAFQRAIPNATECHDDDLVRVGFMSPADLQAFVSTLEAGGLIFRRNGEAVDIAVVDQLRGPTVPAPWLEVGKIEIFEPKLKVCACWVVGQKLDGIAMPAGWKFEGSLSDRNSYHTKNTERDRLEFLRHEDNLDIYVDLLTGKESFVGRPVIKGKTESALFTQLKAISHDLLNIEAQMRTLTDKQSIAPLLNRLNNELLPQVEEITKGAGREMSFAHFTLGLTLRILSRPKDAELEFRKSNKLQPGVINTLLELVRCLGEQNKSQDALPFAREGVKVAPTNAGAWGNLAMCLIRCNKRDEARRTIDYAIQLDPVDQINCHIRDNFEVYFKKS